MAQAFAAIVLVVITPLFAEFLLGNFTLAQLGTLVFLIPMYGSGAVFIREITRHTERGWPTILILGIAYGLLEEGFGDFSIFNPNFIGHRFLDYGYIPVLGIGAPWTIWVLVLHAVWSIATPIALVEAMFPRRASEPWLGRIATGMVGVLLIAGVGSVSMTFIQQDHFVPSPIQLGVTSALILLLGVLAFRLFPGRDHPAQPDPGELPGPWIIGAAAFLAGSAFWLVYQFAEIELMAPPIFSIVAYLAVTLGSLICFFALSARSGWSSGHTFALTCGSVLTYCWYGFVNVYQRYGAQGLAGHSVFAVFFLMLLILSRPQNAPLPLGRGRGRAA